MPTLTLERAPEAALQPEAPQTAAELEQAVLEQVLPLRDPTSREHMAFYGNPEVSGVTPSPLEQVRRPAGGHTILGKNETDHPVRLPNGETLNMGAFKRRGAYNAALRAVENDPNIGRLTTASAGNHGLGVAVAALLLGREADIYGPEDMSPAKEALLKKFGANVYKVPGPLAGAMTEAEAASEQTGVRFIPAFDHADVIAGQATVGVEMLDELLAMQEADKSFDLHRTPINVDIQVGGGGLLAGVAIVFKHARDKGLIGDNVTVTAVEVEDKLTNELSDGTRTDIGSLPALLINDERYVQHRQTVSSLEVADAMHELSGVYNKRIEAAGALAYAAAKARAAAVPTRDGYPATTFIVPVTGANVSHETFDAAMRLRDAAYRSTLAGIAALAIHEHNGLSATHTDLRARHATRIASGK